MTSPPPSPLLGTPYLLSLSPNSPSTSTPAPLPPSLCQNLSAFKSHLRASRSLDDSIILRLNRAQALSGNTIRGLTNDPTALERRRVGERECDIFWRELVGVWDRRTAELGYCEGLVGEGKESGLGMEKGLSRDRTALGRGEGQGEVKVSYSCSPR